MGTEIQGLQTHIWGHVPWRIDSCCQEETTEPWQLFWQYVQRFHF